MLPGPTRKPWENSRPVANHTRNEDDDDEGMQRLSKYRTK